MGTLSTPQRILITGASRGIGAAAARLLAAEGHSVVLAARTRSDLSELARRITESGGRAEVLVMDVRDEESVRLGSAELLRGGHCDVLVNNAGTSEQTEFMLQSEDSMRAEWELNYWGALRVTRALLPSFAERRRGLIVNVSSLLGSVGSPSMANYSASKAALETFSHALRGEVARLGIKVSVFVAPHTDTTLGQASRFEGVRSLPVDYTARELARAIDTAPRKYAASPVYRLLLLLARLFPERMEAEVGKTARAPRLYAGGPALPGAHAVAPPAPLRDIQ